MAGQEVSLYGKDVALSRFKNYQLDPINIKDEINKISVDDLTSFLKRISPDVVITGTGADDMTEKLIWKSCKALRIKSYAILDQWVNYGIRFSRWGVDEIEVFEIEKKLIFSLIKSSLWMILLKLK